MRRAIILCDPDAYANSIKPKELEGLFKKHNYSVKAYSTRGLSRLGTEGLKRILPAALSFRKQLLYIYELLEWLAATQPSPKMRRAINSRIILRIVKLRGKVLQHTLSGQTYDFLICETNLDQAVINEKRIAKTQILDLPAPRAEEVYYAGNLTKKAFKQFKDYEAHTYQQADYLAFHWHMYTDFVKRNKYNGDNFIDLRFGVRPKQVHAKYARDPKIIFLGYLAGEWVNTELLERLCEINPQIDVYGGPAPASGSKINYKGYAPTTDILAQYQFGLITISDDPLRRSSFSSKQLEYYSYGLPVMTPEWRKDALLDAGAIHYNLENFSQLYEESKSRAKWTSLSTSALQIAKECNWQRAHRALENLIKKDKTS